MNVKGNLHIVGLGGAGINIGTAVYKEVSKNAKKFDMANVSIDLMDTTSKNVAMKHKAFVSMFTKIGDHDGLGSEKKSLDQAAAVRDIKTWIAKQKSPSVNDYYVIITSASGASGSSLSALLVSQMLELGYNVVVAMVGDTSNLLYTINTLDTINAMHRVSRRHDTALSTMLYMNNAAGRATTGEDEKKVNSRIVKMMSVISAFLSGDIYNLDHEDLGKFLNPRQYSSINVDPGLYSLGVNTKDQLPDGIVLCRVLAYEESNEDFTTIMTHSKTGIGTENHKALLGEDDVYLYSRNNAIAGTLKELKVVRSNFESLGVVDTSEFEDENDDDIFY